MVDHFQFNHRLTSQWFHSIQKEENFYEERKKDYYKGIVVATIFGLFRTYSAWVVNLCIIIKVEKCYNFELVPHPTLSA